MEDEEANTAPAPVPGLQSPPQADVPPGRQAPRDPSKFATLSSLRDQEESDSEEEGQAFYAGGHEKGGGQQVLGPPRKKADDIIQDMFKSAKEHGAEEVSPDEEVRRPGPSRFGGTGYRLGETEGDSAPVYGGPSVPQPKQMDVVLKLWKNGFSVDDGPLRAFTDPANKEFLESIHQGEIPRELLRLARGGEVNLNMEDHRTEEYVPPKVSVKPFQGEGHMLGSPAPPVNTGPPPSSAASPASVITVNQSEPTTSIQIRLADGSRVVQKFNHTHKVCDIRSHIIATRPQYNGANFILMTTFPNKELTDESVTVKDANLLNAVLVQRMK